MPLATIEPDFAVVAALLPYLSGSIPFGPIVARARGIFGFGLGSTAPARAYLTSNGGTSWFVASLAGNTGGFVSGLAFKENKLNGIAATSTSLPSIARTTDGGVTWSCVNVGASFTGLLYL